MGSSNKSKIEILSKRKLRFGTLEVMKVGDTEIAFLNIPMARPGVAIRKTYGVGCNVETNGRRGLAHFVEHMLFSGTEKFSAPEIEAFMKQLGVIINAETEFDYTALEAICRNTKDEEVYDFLVQLSEHTRFSDRYIRKENVVIRNEIADAPDNNSKRKWEADMSKALFDGLRDVQDPGGLIKNVMRFTGADCRQFWEEYYRPDNCFVVVVGKIRPEFKRHVIQRTAEWNDRYVPTTSLTTYKGKIKASGPRTIFAENPMAKQYQVAVNFLHSDHQTTPLCASHHEVLDFVLTHRAQDIRSINQKVYGVEVDLRTFPNYQQLLLETPTDFVHGKKAGLLDCLHDILLTAGRTKRRPVTQQEIDAAIDEREMDLIDEPFRSLSELADILSQKMVRKEPLMIMGDWIGGMQRVKPETLMPYAKTLLNPRNLVVKVVAPEGKNTKSLRHNVGQIVAAYR